MQNPKRRATFATLVVPVALLAGTLSATGLPETAALEEVQLTVVSEARGLLDQGCDYGNHREVISLGGTGEAELTFDILGEDCSPERREFHLPRSEVETMIRQLFEIDFHLLAADYTGEHSSCIDCVPGHPPGTLIRVDMITSHAPDITVTLRIADFEHSVRYHHGATVAGLREWVGQWQPILQRRAGFLRHFPLEDR